jgi:hypothetical protein
MDAAPHFVADVNVCDAQLEMEGDMEMCRTPPIIRVGMSSYGAINNDPASAGGQWYGGDDATAPDDAEPGGGDSDSNEDFF